MDEIATTLRTNSSPGEAPISQREFGRKVPPLLLRAATRKSTAIRGVRPMHADSRRVQYLAALAPATPGAFTSPDARRRHGNARSGWP